MASLPGGAVSAMDFCLVTARGGQDWYDWGDSG
jgi:hypothetical protein